MCFSHYLTGVGKTSLIHLICHREVLSNPSWTVGCNVEVKVCERCVNATVGWDNLYNCECV